MQTFSFPPRRPSPGFPQRLAELRVKRGLSRAGLARAVGVSNTIVGHWEAGRHYPSAESMQKLAEVLGTTRAFLEGNAPDATPGLLSSGDGGQEPPLGRLTLPDPNVVRAAREQIAASGGGLTAAQVRVVLDLGDYTVAL
jgi:transcriptional regulator with XRE-family HTH domain